MASRLKDPFGLDKALSGHYEVPHMPAQNLKRYFVTQETQRRNASKLSGGRTYKPRG